MLSKTELISSTPLNTADNTADISAASSHIKIYCVKPNRVFAFIQFACYIGKAFFPGPVKENFHGKIMPLP